MTSSVEAIHVPTPSSSTSCVASATVRRRQRGIGRTRRAACKTTSAVGNPIDVTLFGGSTTLPAACSRAYLDGLIGTDVQIPVWDGLDSWISGGYRAEVYGYALFHLTGYTLTSGEPVLYGYFTRGVQVSGAAPVSTSAAPYLGSGSVHLAPQG